VPIEEEEEWVLYMKTNIHFLLHLVQFLEWKNVWDESCRENHCAFNNLFETVRKNVVQPDRPQMTIWRMRIACWIPKATNTHSQHAILIAFLQHNGCKNVPQCYVLRTFPVLSVHEMRPYCKIRRATFRNLSALADSRISNSNSFEERHFSIT